MNKIVFATGNQHKLEEVNKVLDMPSIQLLSLKDIEFEGDIVEDGDTMTENAIIKSQYISDRYDYDVFAEDSGLEIDALNGAPGVITARYAGPQKNAIDNMNLVLKNLEGKSDRSAQFRAVMCLIKNGETHTVEGIVRGKIADKIAEGGGFGYDPIFIPEGYEKTFAELPENIKLTMSHRTQALNKLKKLL